MKQEYKDIIEKISTPPLWWDEVGCPRYVEFHPYHTNNIYANEAALMEIACQECGRLFQVCIARDGFSRRSLATEVKDHSAHYGDPPNACCQCGATMNSIPRRILQYWVKELPTLEWVRKPEMEIDVTPDWAKEEASA